jgi:hypothetical protein
VEDKAVETGVGDEQVAAAAEGEMPETTLAGEMDCFKKFGLCRDLAEEAGRATDA